MNNLKTSIIRHVTSAAIALLAMACAEAPIEDSGLPSADDLRTGYSVISETSENSAYHKRIFLITDVAVRGDTIVVAAVRSDTENYLGGGAFLRGVGAKDASTGTVNSMAVYFLSRDAGKTWKQQEIKAPPTVYVYQGGAPGVALTADGAVIAKLSILRSNAANVEYLYAAIGTLDLDTGVWTRTFDGEFYNAIREYEGRIYSVDSVFANNPGVPDGHGNIFWQVVDGKTGQIVAGSSLGFAPTDCVVAKYWPMVNEFAGLCTVGAQICHFRLNPLNDAAPRQMVCAAKSVAGAAANVASGLIRGTTAGAILLYAEGGKVHGLGLGYSFGPTHDLGVGRMVGMTNHGFHDSFPGMAVLGNDDGVTAVYDFPADKSGPHALALPPTPCRVAGDCPTKAGVLQVAWAQRSGVDEHLVIHDVRTAKGQMLTFGRVQGLSPLPSNELATCAAAPPANALWKACYGEVLCQMDEMAACLMRWSELKGAPGAANPALATFLAADLKSCTALAAADSGVAPVPWDDEGTCTARCDGAVAVTCTDGVLDCKALNGGTCTKNATGAAQCLGEQLPCDPSVPIGCDSEGRLLDCAGGKLDDCPSRGLICAEVSPSFRCVPVPDTCETKGSSCDGEVLTLCHHTDIAPGKKVPRTWERIDCGARGQTCVPGDCVDAAATSEPCANRAEACDGSKLKISSLSSSRTIDCADFGATCGKAKNGSGLTCLR